MMAKIGENARITFVVDALDRYIVMLGDDRAGFVRRNEYGLWNAADTFMKKSRNFKTRREAGEWLRRETERAIAKGEL